MSELLMFPAKTRVAREVRVSLRWRTEERRADLVGFNRKRMPESAERHAIMVV